MYGLTSKVLAVIAGCVTVVVLAGCGGGSAHKAVSVVTSDNPVASVDTSPGRQVPSPGFPSDWQARAIDAARQRLQQCVQSTDVSPIGCPQSSQSSQWVSGYGASPESVQWTLVGQPLANAVAVTSPSGPGSTTGVVDVYGHYAMCTLDAAESADGCAGSCGGRKRDA
jgi:hypothetical protein